MSQRGFTLLEMALVVTIVGLMVGGGLFAVAPIIDKTRANQTNATMDQVENALELFVIRFNRLPCPADGSYTNATTDPNRANYGLELGGGSISCTVAISNAVIPWKTLGIDESYSIDGWGHRLSYWTSGMTGMTVATTQVTSSSPSPGFLYRQGSTHTFPTGNFITLFDVANATQLVTTTNDQAAYVLASHGKSGWYAWSKGGKLLLPSIAVANKACNNSPTCGPNGASFALGGPVGVYPPQSGTYFDDIVRWRSPSFILQLCGSGSCNNP